MNHNQNGDLTNKYLVFWGYGIVDHSKYDTSMGIYGPFLKPGDFYGFTSWGHLMSSSLMGENTMEKTPGILMRNAAYYTNIYAMVNKHNYGTSPFSIAMLVYQRVHCRFCLKNCYPAATPNSRLLVIMILLKSRPRGSSGNIDLIAGASPKNMCFYWVLMRI